MLAPDDKRLIEDYLPIEAISAEAAREKSTRTGHISTLHHWWARRPLVACRAAVYAALVPVSHCVPNAASDEKKKSLGRANAAKFIKRLCQYPNDSKPEGRTDINRAVKEAEEHTLGSHPDRLAKETGKKVTTEDITAGRAPRPRILDMFAGGGAIPLETLRLGCEACTLDLNPLAHTADSAKLYVAWNAVVNLADLAGKVTINLKAQKADGLDKTKLQNGVLDPSREADLIE